MEPLIQVWKVASQSIAQSWRIVSQSTAQEPELRGGRCSHDRPVVLHNEGEDVSMGRGGTGFQPYH